MDRGEFEALGQSVLAQVVAYIGETNLRSAAVTGHLQSLCVEVELQLRKDTWEAQSQAIDKMIEVRELFLGEVSLDYWFVSHNVAEDHSSSTPFAFAMA